MNADNDEKNAENGTAQHEPFEISEVEAKELGLADFMADRTAE